MKRILDSMWGYWFLLLVISLGTAATIYQLWLKGRI